MNRRNFLTRSGLALGALLVGDEALEAFARLTHVRKSFPSADPRHLRHDLPSAQWRCVRLAAEIDVSGEVLVHYEGARGPSGPFERLQTMAVLDGQTFSIKPFGLPALGGRAMVAPGNFRLTVVGEAPPWAVLPGGGSIRA